MEEIDSCVLSLIGKFLTCKPYNHKAAKKHFTKIMGTRQRVVDFRGGLQPLSIQVPIRL